MLSEDLRTLSQELGELSRRGFGMTPEALEIIGALVGDMASDAANLEGGKRPSLVLIINKDRS